MISFTENLRLELRKRVDTRGAVAGFVALAIIVGLCGAASVSVVKSATAFGASEVVVIVGLPIALVSAIVGAAVGVGDAPDGAEWDGILSGLTRDSIYVARASACAVLIALLVAFSVGIALLSVVAAVLAGGHLSSMSIAPQLGQVAAFAFSSGALGFGIGAVVRRLALALVVVLLIVLVLDTVLAFAGPWSAFVRFGSLQSSLIGDGPVLPGITSGLLWIGLPLVGGLLRARTAEV